MKFEYPRNLRFSCNRCGICCGDTSEKKRRVLLLKAEAERLADHLGKEICEFAEPVEKKAPYVFQIKKKKTGKCVFFDGFACTVYDLRPLVCRFYPFELSPDEGGKFRFTATDECPFISKAETNVLDAAYFRPLLQLALKELSSVANLSNASARISCLADTV